MRNCLVYGNAATGTVSAGGGIYCAGDGGKYYVAGVAHLENCTVAHNLHQGIRRSTGAVSMTNCIVWGNATNVVGEITAATSDIGDEGVAGEGCIHADPLFKNADRFDFRLRATSPCINKGANAVWMAGAFDLAGNPRIGGRTVDMGAYESFTPSGTLLLLR